MTKILFIQKADIIIAVEHTEQISCFTLILDLAEISSCINRGPERQGLNCKG